jgi:hypothetical protein
VLATEVLRLKDIDGLVAAYRSAQHANQSTARHVGALLASIDELPDDPPQHKRLRQSL